MNGPRWVPRTAPLVLWDIDGTLISGGPACEAIYPQAFARLTGYAPSRTVETSGRTELEIMHELFALHGLARRRDDLIAEALVEALAGRLDDLRRDGAVLPGAAQALRELSSTGGVVSSVLTGNLRRNALLKLRTFGLHGLLDLDVGAYGCDDPVRSKLVGVARGRAEAKYRRAFPAENTVLIGDTVRDVRTARDNGARIIAVASGADDAVRLRAAGAAVVLADLQDTPSLIRLLLGTHDLV